MILRTAIILFAWPLAAQQTISYSPPSLSFTSNNGSVPPMQEIFPALNPVAPSREVVTDGATEVQGQQWLRAAFPNGGASGRIIPGVRIQVTVNPAGLPNGTYRGTVSIYVADATPIPTASIPVTLTVSGAPGIVSPNPSLLVLPSRLTFRSILNNAPPSQTLTLATNVAASLAYSMSPSVPWITVVNGTGTTPAYPEVRINPVGLPIGTHSGSIAITTLSASTPTTLVPVTVDIVPPESVFTLFPRSFTFLGFEGVRGPITRDLSITSATSLPVSLVTGGQPWLSVSPPTGMTPVTFAITANPANLAIGEYTSFVEVRGAGAVIRVPVTLAIIRNDIDVRFSEKDISFEYQRGQALPPPRLVALSAFGIATATSALPIPYSAVSDRPWLSVSSSGTSPSPIVIGLDPTAARSLSPGTHVGSVTVSTPSVLTPVNVFNVTLRVGDSPRLIPSNAPFLFSASNSRFELPLRQQTRLITASSGVLDVTVSTKSDPNILVTASLNSRVTPATLTVNVTPKPAFVGSFLAGTVILTSAGNTVEIPVFYARWTFPRVQLSATELHFSGTNRFLPQTLEIASTNAPVTYTVTPFVVGPTNWLSVTTTSLTTPATMAVIVNTASLAEGTYQGGLVVLGVGAEDQATVVPVTLVISTDTLLRASPAGITFAQSAGGAPAPPQPLRITSGLPIPFRASVREEAATWLRVSQPSGFTNGAPLEVALTPSAGNLPSGTYTGTILVSSQNSPATLSVEVKLTVTERLAPLITGVVHAATYRSGELSPGMVVTLTGARLGPSSPVSGELANGRFTSSLAGVSVLFDSIPAPILYAGATQINAVVPYAMAGRASARVTVVQENLTSPTFSVRLNPVAAGIFTVDGRQAAALNQDGTVNSPANPAVPGSIVTLFLTGEGLTTPAGIDGELVPPTNLRRPQAAVAVFVNGLEIPASRILYAGSAPSLVAGLMQVNFRLPDESVSNPATPIEVSIGSSTSPSGTTIAVR